MSRALIVTVASVIIGVQVSLFASPKTSCASWPSANAESASDLNVRETPTLHWGIGIATKRRPEESAMSTWVGALLRLPD